jgi:hypothetical protein
MIGSYYHWHNSVDSGPADTRELIHSFETPATFGMPDECAMEGCGRPVAEHVYTEVKVKPSVKRAREDAVRWARRNGWAAPE